MPLYFYHGSLAAAKASPVDSSRKKTQLDTSNESTGYMVVKRGELQMFPLARTNHNHLTGSRLNVFRKEINASDVQTDRTSSNK